MSDRCMAICRECSDEGFVGYVMAIPFDAPAERDAWMSGHIEAHKHTVLGITGGWLSPRDVQGYMQAVNWAAIDDGTALRDGRYYLNFRPEDEAHT
jgi:hypothetical protein